MQTTYERGARMETNSRAERRQTDGKEGYVQEWISLREMQEILGIGSTKAYELAASGTIPGVIKIGRIIRINRGQLDGWLSEQMISPKRKI